MRCALVGSRTNTNLLATGLIQPPLAVMPAVPRRPERPLVVLCRLGYSSHLSSHGLRQEVILADPARRAKLVRDLEQDFVPDYDAQNMPSGDKRAAYALEHIAFRVGRIEQSLARIAAAIESVLSKG
jgi:hypothetical protein